ncbi:MAG TPA: pyridoxal-phosphate dependent enzyme, partial [Gemmatimonadales bacterium]|nr:pyridoxal-phosphate dependent enzyme [Gemmatimonadales bacterium]
MSLFHTPRPASWQVCLACGNELVETDPATRCGCGGLLEVRHHAPGVTGPLLRATFQTRCCTRPDTVASGVWRFREVVMPSATDPELVSHPEGNTPLLWRDTLASWAGVDRLHIKHEGHNPTGSFKDRGMTVGVTQARRIGARAVA